MARGHLLASSYRGCGDKNNPAEINKQTFLACNISAQRMDNSKAFQTLWAAAERRFTISMSAPIRSIAFRAPILPTRIPGPTITAGFRAM